MDWREEEEEEGKKCRSETNQSIGPRLSFDRKSARKRESFSYMTSTYKEEGWEEDLEISKS